MSTLLTAAGAIVTAGIFIPAEARPQAQLAGPHCPAPAGTVR